MVTIDEKILKKYKGIAFNDIKVGILYNEIEQYGESLRKYKECLNKFKNLQKEKSEYIDAQKFIKSFEAYPFLSDYEAPPKPPYPFSEAYKHPEEESEVKSELYHIHGRLRELYAGIFSYKESQ